MALQDTTKRGKGSARGSVPFSLTTSSPAGSRHPSCRGLLQRGRLMAKAGGGGRAVSRVSLSPSASLPPTWGSCAPPCLPPAQKRFCGLEPYPKSPLGLSSLPKVGRCPGEKLPPQKGPPKEPGPLGLTPPPLQAAQPSSEREGRREGAWCCPSEPGQGGGWCQWGKNLMKS